MITQDVLLRFSSSIEKMENWRVLLAESEPAFRQDMVKVLAGMPGMNLVAKVANGWDVMFTSAQLKPDIILLDFSLPGLSGPEVTSLIKRGLPQALVIILLDNENEEDKKAVERCGAWACLVKSHLAQELPALMAKLEQLNRGNGNSN
mgnify:CR=1 FL=1